MKNIMKRPVFTAASLRNSLGCLYGRRDHRKRVIVQWGCGGGGGGLQQANCCFKKKIQGDQKVCVRLMIIIQKVTSNIQRVPRQSPDIY
jgi:hypothetical protein